MSGSIWLGPPILPLPDWSSGMVNVAGDVYFLTHSGTLANAWGVTQSGLIENLSTGSSPFIPFRSCPKCKMQFSYTVGDQINVLGVSGLSETWCWSCAGYKYEQGGAVRGFTTREDWIREAIPPFMSGCPVGIVADWCEDNGRYADATYLRKCEMKGILNVGR